MLPEWEATPPDRERLARATEPAHGSKGSFVSKWVLRKSDHRVLSGSDLIPTIMFRQADQLQLIRVPWTDNGHEDR